LSEYFNTKTQWGTLFGEHKNYTVDKESCEILKILLKNSRENLAQIAIKTGYSVDIVRNRMKKMESLGIINRYTIDIDYKTLGYEFYKTFLYFNNLDEEQLQRLTNYCLLDQNIIHIVKQISSWDIELEIMCENYHKYNEIISKLTEQFSDIINKTETAIMSEDHVFPSQKLIFES
jgi:DNA-binding Lrp family transcriptional regulator